MAIRSPEEWEALPEIMCPVIEGARKGSIYTVHAVGFLAMPVTGCKEVDLSGVLVEGEKCLLPTATIEFAEERQLCKLPLQLSDWALQAVALARQLGRSPFPLQVEFGILNGSHYAEML
jgi:hypothetical protein